jgi:hypothetical protein
MRRASPARASSRWCGARCRRGRARDRPARTRAPSSSTPGGGDAQHAASDVDHAGQVGVGHLRGLAAQECCSHLATARASPRTVASTSRARASPAPRSRGTRAGRAPWTRRSFAPW